MATIIDRIAELADNEPISLTKLEEEIGAGKGILTKARKNGTDIQSKWVSAICSYFSNWSADWIMRGVGDKYKRESPSAIAEENSLRFPTKPHIEDVSAVAGYNSGGAAQSVMGGTVSERPVIMGMPDYDMTIRVNGDSMYPYLCSGDLIAIREIDMFKFKPGEIYVVSTDEDAFVKRVFRSNMDGMVIRCESINPSFPPFDLAADSILKMYRVVGLQRLI